MVANYIMDGRIIMLPITGNGIGYGNFTDIDAIVALQLERYRNERTGLIHQKVDDIYVDFEIGHATVRLDNLFNGDETLSAAMNLFLNENWSTVITEIRPKLEETVAMLVTNFTNTIFSVFPEDVLLPPWSKILYIFFSPVNMLMRCIDWFCKFFLNFYILFLNTVFEVVIKLEIPVISILS